MVSSSGQYLTREPGTPTRFIFRVEFRAVKRARSGVGERAIVQEFAPHTSSISDSMAHVKVNRYRREIASRRWNIGGNEN